MKGKVIGGFLFSLFLAHLFFLVCILLFIDTTILQSRDLSLFYSYAVSYHILSIGSVAFPSALWLLMVAIEVYKSSNKEYGDAQFASNHEISRMHDKGVYESQGSIFGLKDHRYIRTSSPLSTLIVAPQGTGKTAAVIIPTLLSNTSSFLINDIKGELWDLTSKQRSHFGRVGIFAPSQNLKDSFSWNPLDEKVLPNNFDDQIDFVERIGSILYPTDHDGMDSNTKHFNAEGKAIFTYFCMLLIGKKGGTSLPEIYRVALDNGDMQESIACDIDEFGDDWNPILFTIANSLIQKGGNEWNSSLTTFKQALEPFSRPNIARNLERCDFTHLDFKADKPLSLYMFIPANDVSRLAPIIRMLIEYLVNEFLSITDKNIINAQHVVFAMDEFPRMGYMKALKEAPALQRGYNMSSIFVAQDKNQLETTYGKGSFDQFVTTTDFKVIFRQNEDTTAARFSSLVGKTTQRKKSVSKQDLKLLGSISESKEGLPLILPQDFMNQKKNYLTILISGHYERPIYCKLAWWFKDTNMRKLVGSYNDLTISDLAQTNDTLKATTTTKEPSIEPKSEINIINSSSIVGYAQEEELNNALDSDEGSVQVEDIHTTTAEEIKEPTLDF